MQFLVLAFAALAVANPFIKRSSVCPSDDTPLCCQLDVEGILDATCETPSDTSSVDNFKSCCAADGYTAMCCVLPLAGDGLLCSSPSG